MRSEEEDRQAAKVDGSGVDGLARRQGSRERAEEQQSREESSLQAAQNIYEDGLLKLRNEELDAAL